MLMVLRLSKYERVRVLAQRMLELERGAAPVVPVPEGSRFLEVALRELEEGQLPYQLVRHLPGGREQICELSQSTPAVKRARSGAGVCASSGAASQGGR